MRSFLAAAALLSLASVPASAQGVLEGCSRPRLNADFLPVFPVTIAPGTPVRAGPYDAARRTGTPASGQSWSVVDLCGRWALVMGSEDAVGYVPIRSLRPDGRPLDRSLFDRVRNTSGYAAARVWRLGSIAR